MLKVNCKGVATQLQQNAGNVTILAEQNFALKIVQRDIREILCNIALDSNLIFRQTKKKLKLQILNKTKKCIKFINRFWIFQTS